MRLPAKLFRKKIKPTDEHWFVLKRKAEQAFSKLRGNSKDKEDAVSYTLTFFDQIWDKWDPKKLSWDGFCFMVALRKVADYIRIEISAKYGCPSFTSKRRVCRLVPISHSDSGIDLAYVCNKTREPYQIYEDKETLNRLYGRLSDGQIEELQRWYIGEEGLLKIQTNRRDKIRLKAYRMLDAEDYLNWLFYIMVQKRRVISKHSRNSRSCFRISLLAEKSLPEYRLITRKKENKSCQCH